MKPGIVRAIAICLIRRGDDIFVAEGCDPQKKQAFYRPLGGTIEFGEYSRDTVVRELQEEIGAAIRVGRSLGVLENVFVYDGQTGHEIVLLHEAEFEETRFYETETIQGEDDGAVIFTACWKPLDFFRSGQAPLYPTGLLELIDSL